MTLKDQKNSETPTDATVADAAETEAAKAVSRRMMFGGGMLGIATFLAAACSSSDFSSGSKNGVRKTSDGGKGKADAADSDDDDSGSPTGKTATGGSPGNATDGPTGGDGTPGNATSQATANATGDADAQGTGTTSGSGSTDPQVDLTDCHANNTNQLDVSGVADATGDMVPDAKFYGTKRSTLVALKFKAAVTDLKQVIIMREDGTLLALHGVSAADKNASGWRPIVVDNLWVGDSANIVILMQFAAERKKCKIPVAFFTSFNNATVQDLSQHDNAAVAGFADKQAVCQFADPSGVSEDTNAKYPNKYNTTGNRYLQTAQSSSTWGVGAATNPGGSCVFTDIMGNVITGGMGGAAILEYQVFCAYYISGGTAYRTMLHIG